MAEKSDSNLKKKNWHRGMKSPNPGGRPKGIIDKRMRLNSEMAKHASSIAQVVIDAAKDGDMHAANLVLSRVTPTLSSRAPEIEFNLDTDQSPADQVAQVLRACADAELSPEHAKIIIDGINSLSALRQVESFELRLEALEKKG